MEFTEERIRSIVDQQRQFFMSDRTLDVNWRIRQLKLLKQSVIDHEEEIIEALRKDLGRSAIEAYFCDIGTTIMELNEAIRSLKKWAKPDLYFSGFACFPSIFTRVYKMPYGVSLIMSPFNFPIFLTFGALVASIAGGNTAVLKTSSKSPTCTALMKQMISEIFPEEYIVVVDGGHDVADMCLAQRFDKIFYTGSPAVGRHILEEAAKNLTPVTLELGGETGNWCVVRKDADLKDAARKIAFMKILNSGQVCININQVAVAEEVVDEFLEHLKAAIQKQLGDDPVNNPDYAHLINREAWQRCADEADKYRDRIVLGGNGNPENLRYAPTLIYPVDPDEDIVQHELFSPLLPIVPYPDDEIDELMDIIASREHGLALYLFTKDIKWANRTMSTQQYGGGCINEVALQLMVPGAPFNGTGHSGMGAYHGEWGFREFTHPSTVLKGYTRFNLSLREHPYRGKKASRKMRLLKFFMR